MLSHLLILSFVVTCIDLCCIFIVIRVLLDDWLLPKWFDIKELDFKARKALTNHVGMLFFKALCLVGVIPMLLMQPDSERVEGSISIGDILGAL